MPELQPHSLPTMIPAIADAAGVCGDHAVRLAQLFRAIKQDARTHRCGDPRTNGDRIRAYADITAALRADVKVLVEELVRRELVLTRATGTEMDEDKVFQSIADQEKAARERGRKAATVAKKRAAAHRADTLEGISP